MNHPQQSLVKRAGQPALFWMSRHRGVRMALQTGWVLLALVWAALAQAATDIKSNDAKKIAEAMKGGKAYKTVIGDISFDKKGDITRPDYVMYTWKKGADGKITYIEN